MKPRNYRNILFISLSQLGMNFSFNFVMIIIPFLIQKVILLDKKQVGKTTKILDLVTAMQLADKVINI